MEKSGKIKRSHRILSIPVLASVLMYIYCYVLRSIVVGIAEPKMGELYGFAVFALTIVMLFIHKFWFRPEYKGSFRMDLLKEKSIVIPIIVYLVIDIILISTNWIEEGIQMPTLQILAISLMAGVGEEVCYRVVMLTTELRAWLRKGSSSYLPALLTASLVFGLSHFLNIAAGAHYLNIIIQVITTVGAGLIMGAIFLRSGNILYPIIIHFLHDFLAFLTYGSLITKTTPPTFMDVAWIVGLFIIQAAIAVWLLKGRKDEIIAIWKERWSITD